MGSGPPEQLHFNLINYICDDSISPQAHILRCWELGHGQRHWGWRSGGRRDTIQATGLRKSNLAAQQFS